jgi:hypothetical protein
MRVKIKKIVEEIFKEKFKPTSLYLFSRIGDMATTYLNLKYNPSGVEANPLMREIFNKFGVELGSVLNIGMSSIVIPFFYLYQKFAEKVYEKTIKRKPLKLIKNLYDISLYSLTSSSIYTSVNNILVYLNLPVPENNYQISFLASLVPVAIYCYKYCKDLKKGHFLDSLNEK